jgi:hypothetical protein
MTGQVANPPAPRPLDLYAVSIESGVVKVDTRNKIRRIQSYVDAVLMLGDLYVRQGRASQAQALYERSLARTDIPPGLREPISQRLNLLKKNSAQEEKLKE